MDASFYPHSIRNLDITNRDGEDKWIAYMFTLGLQLLPSSPSQQYLFSSEFATLSEDFAVVSFG